MDYNKYYDSNANPAFFYREPTRVIYLVTVDSISQGSLIQLREDSDLTLRGRLVKFRSNTVRVFFENGSNKNLRPSQIRLIEQDNELTYSVPIPH